MWGEGESWVCGEGGWGGDQSFLLIIFMGMWLISYPDLTLFFPWPWEIWVRDKDVVCWKRYIFGFYPEKGIYFWEF